MDLPEQFEKVATEVVINAKDPVDLKSLIRLLNEYSKIGNREVYFEYLNEKLILWIS